MRTKNRILKGSEIEVGGSIIMPIAHGDGGDDQVDHQERKHDQKADLEPAPDLRNHKRRHDGAQIDPVANDDRLPLLLGDIDEQLQILIARVGQHELAERLGDTPSSPRFR